MWVLLVMFMGSNPHVDAHDFDDHAACTHAAVIVNSWYRGDANATCVERYRSVLGPHDDALAPTP